MGGKTATSTSQVSIPPEVLARYNAVNAKAEAAASTPFQSFGTNASDYVAQINPQQTAGIGAINSASGSYQPYISAATDATKGAMTGLSAADIQKYMSPYLSNVADTTAALMRQSNEQAQSGALGTAAMSGAFGGDRAGIAAANLAGQNQLAMGKTMADIYQQGYGQALGTAQQQQGFQLQGAEQLAGLGAQAQGLGLQGAQAQIAAGTMQQQTEQAGKDAMIQRFMQEKGYPFQTAQFLANVALGTGAASGSTTTSRQPVGIFGNLATGGKVDGYAGGGGVSGQANTYVPEGNLPVGQLMVAEPPEREKRGGLGDAIDLAKKFAGFASGGVAGGRHGYENGGNPQFSLSNLTGSLIPDYKGYLARKDDERRDYAAKAAAETQYKEYPVNGDVWHKTPQGVIANAYGNPVDIDQAETVRNAIESQDMLAGGQRLVQSDEMANQFRQSQEALAQRNKDALVGMYEGKFPVSGLAAASQNIPSGGPGTFPAAEFPAKAQPGTLAHPVHPDAFFKANLGAAYSNMRSADAAQERAGRAGEPAPQRPADLGTAITTTPAAPGASANLGSPAPSQQPAQGGIYSGVASSGKGFIDLMRPDGTVEHRVGAVNWRNNNPGNLEYGDFAKQYGAIGTDGRFAVFPDYETGMKAMSGLLFNSGSYAGMTISDAMAKYSPPSENDTGAKISRISAETGMPPDMPLDQMTPAQKAAFVLAIQHTEGPMKGDIGASSPYTASPLNGGLGAANVAAPPQPGGVKPYEDRNAIGKFFHNPQTNKMDPNAVLSVLTGLGAMASSNTLSPISALLQGVGAGAGTYKDLQRQASDIALQEAQARRAGVITAGETGGPSLDISGNRVQPLLGEMETPGINLPYQAQDGMKTVFSSPEVKSGLQIDNQLVYPNSSPQTIAAADTANAVQQGYSTAKNSFTPVMSSFGAASSLIANPGLTGAGPGADLRANLAAATNMVLSSLGYGPISVSDLADKAAILKKVASAAAAAGQGSNPSVEALMNALNTQGDAGLPPEALASITAQNLVDRQMALDKGEFYHSWGQSQGIKSRTGNATYLGAEPTFSQTIGQKYNAEKAFLEQIMLAPGNIPERVAVRDQLIHLSSGGAGSGFTPEAVQAAIKEAYPGAPDDLWKVFFNKGLAE